MIKDFVKLVCLLIASGMVSVGLSNYFNLDFIGAVVTNCSLLFLTALFSEAYSWLKYNKIVIKTERCDTF